MKNYFLLLMGILFLVISFSLSSTDISIKILSGFLGGFLLGEFTVAIFKKDE